jgi:hypothetical protein
MALEAFWFARRIFLEACICVGGICGCSLQIKFSLIQTFEPNWLETQLNWTVLLDMHWKHSHFRVQTACLIIAKWACMHGGVVRPVREHACTAEWFDLWCPTGQWGFFNLRYGSICSPLFTLTGQRGSNRGASIRTPCRLSYDTSLLLAMGGVCITSGESLAKVTPLGATLLGGTDLMTALPSLRREVLWVNNMLRS